MGTSYIAKDLVYTVCTYQLNSDPRKLSNSCETPTVFYGDTTEHPLLNINDRNLDKEFTCKSPWNIALGFLAFGAGLLVAAAMLSNPAGWIILAGAACVAIGTVATVSAACHKCTDPLLAGEWHMTHTTVKINGEIAITRSSILICDKGGVLTPFFSYAAACQAAGDIANNNRWELGLNTVGSFFAGFFLPEAVATGIGSLLVKTGVSYAAFSLLTWGERGAIRLVNENAGDLKDNEFYENINNADPNGKPFAIPEKPGDVVQDITDIPNGVKSVKPLVNNAGVAYDLKTIDGLSRPVLMRDPTAQNLLKGLNEGKYPEWKANSEHFNSGRMNPSTVSAGKETTSKAIKANGKQVFKGLLSLIPFVTTFLSENARADLAKALAADAAAAGLDVTAENPVD